MNNIVPGAGSPSKLMDAVLDRLRAYPPISGDELNLIRGLAASRTRSRAGDALIPHGARAMPRFLLTGWAAYQSTLRDGRRQIHRFILPGDVFGLPEHVDYPGCEIVALTDASFVEALPVIAAVRSGRAAGLAAAIAEASQDHLRLLNGALLRLGRMTAYERTADLLLELADRLALAGLGDGRRFPLPLTQEVLADALGLSIVHTNRVLQQLRRDRLIELRSGLAVLLDVHALQALARAETRAARQATPHKAPPLSSQSQPAA